MNPQRYICHTPEIRANAVRAVTGIQTGAGIKPLVVEIKPLTRTLEQNSKLWACLSDVSRQVEWHGRKLTPEEWKHVFSAALKKQDVVPGIDGGFVVLGQSTSQMTVREMADLIELAQAFGVEHGVRFGV